jgi:hypothetical protein
MSTIKVDGIRSNSATSDAITLASDGTCTAKITNNLSNRNLIINGAMQVAQRGTSSTSSGYHTIDRFRIDYGGTDENPTQAQADVTSGGAYDAGFRKCLKFTNGNHTNGAGNSDYVQILTRLEGQDIANSGWNYTSTSSYITLSFWVKSSVAQVFSGSLRAVDGTAYSYKFDTPSLSANTWTKVTKTIPGNSNLTFDNDNGTGLDVYLFPSLFSTYASSNANTETWITAQTNTYANLTTSTWYTTNDATFEITGVQLEVGSVATDFEHRSFGEELQLCKRYYQQINQESSGTSILQGFGNGSGRLRAVLYLPVEMRANPTVALDVSGGNPSFYSYTGGNPSYSSLSGVESTKKNIVVDINTSNLTAGAPYDWRGSGAFITIAAEL